MAAIPGGSLVDGSAAVTGADQTLFAQNTSRQHLFIQNPGGTNDIWVQFGEAAVADQPSIRVAPGATLRYDAPGVVPTAEVHCIGTALDDVVAKEA